MQVKIANCNILIVFSELSLMVYIFFMYEAFRAMNVVIFWNAIPCSLVDAYRHFGGTRFPTTMSQLYIMWHIFDWCVLGFRVRKPI